MATKKTGSSKSKNTTVKKVGKAVTGAAKSVASALGIGGKKKTTKKKSGTAKKKTASKSTARRK